MARLQEHCLTPCYNRDLKSILLRKLRGRRGYIYKRGHDWIVGYDTGSEEIETEEGHEKLSYVIPGLLQLGGGDHDDHQGGEGVGRGLLPGAGGWLYLTRDRDWLYDPSVTVTRRYSR